ncbi:MAG: hypothetical protein JO314_04230 [Acidobacteria bacterium]|nr:hypothetical protein [Acidobacteriota bacterium]
MSDGSAIERRPGSALREKAPAALTVGVVALLLYVIGFPIFLLGFFGALAFFVWKVFTSESRTETRRTFEFYLVANDILRDDDKRWFGFEIRDAAARGEAIIRTMPTAPPLVHFALGALYQKMDDHGAAVKHLSTALEDISADESSIVFPSKDLREYVRMLRRIERAPAEAPLTSAAVRSLERARKNRGKKMLEFSREQLATGKARELHTEASAEAAIEPRPPGSVLDMSDEPAVDETRTRKRTPRSPDSRKTISEVLHDIYDTNIQ